MTIRLDGHELFSHKTAVNFRDRLRNRSIITLGGLVLPKPGKLIFEFTLNDSLGVKYEVDIVASGPKAITA